MLLAMRRMHGTDRLVLEPRHMLGAAGQTKTKVDCELAGTFGTKACHARV